MILSRRRLLDVTADPVDDFSRAGGIAHETGERLPDFTQIRRVPVEEVHGCTGIVVRGGDGLREFWHQRGGELCHDAHTVHVGEMGPAVGGMKADVIATAGSSISIVGMACSLRTDPGPADISLSHALRAVKSRMIR